MKATFFLVGQWVDKYPESVKALADAGHEIENHSDTHPHLTQCSSEAIITELEGCNEKIKKITGKEPKLHRCPYGDYNDTVIRTVRSIGMEPIQWNVDSLDWKNLGVTPMVERVTKNLAPGAIVLFHNNSQYITEALPIILDAILEEGYEIVPVSELIVDGEYWIDHTGKQYAGTMGGANG